MIDSGIFILKIAARLAHLLAATKFLCKVIEVRLEISVVFKRLGVTTAVCRERQSQHYEGPAFAVGHTRN
jgi:hypothetical protein